MHTYLKFDDVDQYGPQQQSKSFALSGEEILRDEVDQFDKVTISARASQGDLAGDYIVEGDLELDGALRCSRCVEPFRFANRSGFRLTYRPRPEGDSSEEELELAQQDLEVEYYTVRQVELGELATEQIQLTLPMKPLCSDECRGLCSRCGTNMNQQSCSCAEEMIDERWGALQKIREELLKK